MSVHGNVGPDRYPNQDEYWFRRAVLVCFGYDARRTFRGVVVRADVEDPWRTVIQLDDGRVLLSTECAYRAVG